MKDKAKAKVFKVGIGRKVALLAIFGVILPFFISMPVMTTLRAVHGNIADAATMAVITVVFALILAYLVLQIQAATKIRFTIDDEGADLSFPNWRGLAPTSPYAKARLAFADIAAVEERGEIYHVLGLVGIPRVSSLVTKDGRRLVLGYVNENDDDPAVHYGTIAEKIATRANLDVEDKGVVDVGTQFSALFRGTPDWDAEPVPEKKVEQARKRADMIRTALVLTFFLLLGMGGLFVVVPELQSFYASLPG